MKKRWTALFISIILAVSMMLPAYAADLSVPEEAAVEMSAEKTESQSAPEINGEAAKEAAVPEKAEENTEKEVVKEEESPEKPEETAGAEKAEEAAPAQEEVKAALTPDEILKDAKKIIIIPGYGMALAQAQSKVKALADKLEEKGAEVKFAIHPVAGRMPGHMNVLLCEVDVPYDKLYEMDVINPEFAGCDAVIFVGANDVITPAANTAEGTPIYGMPVLNAADAKYVIICNFDENPGYAGVPNPLYKNSNTLMLLGDANETVQSIIDCI